MNSVASERLQTQIERRLDQIEEAADVRYREEITVIANEVNALDPENVEAPAFLRAAATRLTNVTLKASEFEPQGPPVVDNTNTGTSQTGSFSGVRYVVRKFLGEGGKKLVYLAHD